MTELLPCPFCGEKAYMQISQEMETFVYYIICPHCDSAGLKSFDKEKAVKRWNTRHYPPEVQKMIDEAKPRKLIVSSYDKDIVFCPRCREAFSLKKIRSLRPEIDKSGCPRCKQALDWS